MPRIWSILLVCAAAAAISADEKGIEFFEKKIRPVLVEHCYECHSQSSRKIQGGLVLDSRGGIRMGGESGPAVVPFKPSESLLLNALRHDDLEMPPDRRLPSSVISDFEQWIKSGAADPRDGKSVTSKSDIDWQKAKKFWAFSPPTAKPAPTLKNPRWVNKRIDAFVLARLERAGIEPSAAADRRTLLRRLTFSLIGLPPTREQIDFFLQDETPVAVERLVDELLNSPHYGEKWARLWLDVARYAEDQAHIVGNNSALFYPNAYLYRDWVIGTLNDDMPYDQFIKEQLAADLLHPDKPERHAALGFIGLGPKYYRRNDPQVMADEWEDRVDTVTRGLIGLTVACARCHDHKFDPISTQDYYALAGVFASTEMFNRPLTPKSAKKGGGQAKSPKDGLHIVRDKSPHNIHVFIRGDANRKGPEVPRRFLTVLGGSTQKAFTNGSGRADLAQAIVDRSNPLTARVIVNRIWAMHFGRPLVGTPSNFGHLGETPTHPALLDDLAVRFMDNGWSLKWLHREIALSATFQQQSADREVTADPANKLLWRMNRRRLDIESWRDAILHGAGRLTTAIGGPSMDPANPKEQRRTLYSRISRLELNPMLATFDFPDPNAHSAKRANTTTPLQKLFVMNSPFMVAQSRAMAHRLLAGCSTDEERITMAYEALFARTVKQQEKDLAIDFLSNVSGTDIVKWTQYCQVLLASNEMLMID